MEARCTEREITGIPACFGFVKASCVQSVLQLPASHLRQKLFVREWFWL